MITDQELEDMRRDYDQIDFEGQVAKEELRLMREGHIIVVPHDVEHARAMFKMASFYLSQHDPEFKLKMEK